MSYIGHVPHRQPWHPTPPTRAAVIRSLCCAGLIFLAGLLALAAIAVPFDGDVLTEFVLPPG